MNTEQRICAAVIRKLRSDGFELDSIHEEVVVVLDGQEVSIDIVALKDGEITVIEAGDHLDDRHVAQCLRWIGSADRIVCCSKEPRSTSTTHNNRRRNLRRAGVGIYYVGATTWDLIPFMRGDQHTLMVKPQKQSKVNHDLILSSLASVRGPAAGSSGVRRVRPDKWDSIRTALKESGPATLGWLKAEVNTFRPGEWREFQKAVQNGDAPGICTMPHTTPRQYVMEDML